MIEVNVLDHLASAQEGRHRLQQSLAGPKKAHACGAAKLMGAAHQEITAQSGHIHHQVGQALTGIHEHQSPGGVGQLHHLLNRIEAAEGIAHLHQAYELGALADLAAQILQIQLTALGEARMAQHAASARRQQLPGDQVGVVLHHREQHLITGAQVGLAPAASHQVDRLAGIAGKHDFSRIGRTDEGGSFAAGCLKAFSSASTELVGAAVHVGVVVVVVVLQGRQYLTGLLAGGGVIEIDQRLAKASRLGQQWEIRPGEGSKIRRNHLKAGGRCGGGYCCGGGGGGHGCSRNSSFSGFRAAAAGSSRNTSSQ